MTTIGLVKSIMDAYTNDYPLDTRESRARYAEIVYAATMLPDMKTESDSIRYILQCINSKPGAWSALFDYMVTDYPLSYVKGVADYGFRTPEGYDANRSASGIKYATIRRNSCVPLQRWVLASGITEKENRKGTGLAWFNIREERVLYTFPDLWTLFVLMPLYLGPDTQGEGFRCTNFKLNANNTRSDMCLDVETGHYTVPAGWYTTYSLCFEIGGVGPDSRRRSATEVIVSSDYHFGYPALMAAKVENPYFPAGLDKADVENGLGNCLQWLGSLGCCTKPALKTIRRERT